MMGECMVRSTKTTVSGGGELPPAHFPSAKPRAHCVGDHEGTIPGDNFAGFEEDNLTESCSTSVIRSTPGPMKRP